MVLVLCALRVTVIGSFVPAIATKDLKVERLLGEGAFKAVHRASWNGLGVAKCDMLASVTDAKASAAFEAELTQLSVCLLFRVRCFQLIPSVSCA